MSKLSKGLEAIIKFRWINEKIISRSKTLDSTRIFGLIA